MSQANEFSAKGVSDAFARQAQSTQRSFLGEFLYFLTHNKKWWLAPILVVLLLVGTLLILSSTALAPLLYTLF
ncbi:MAG TPA: DUF5989 family protein [Tepidisphaeraceae bacterium]|nr:DUF5989 family protein [Tepidisphaeraceae bacterium]